MAWLSGWDYRKPLVITGGASGAQTDFQLDIAIAHAAAKMQADFDDIRFTQADGTTLVDAWLEAKVDSTSADTWVEFPTTPANTVEQTYYMYYGKSDAVSDWDIGNTFIFGDDFPGSSFDSAKWNQDYTGCGSTASVGSSILTLDCGTGCDANLQRMLGSVNNFQSDNVALRFKHNVNAGGSERGQTWMGNTKPPTGIDDAYLTVFTPSTTRAYDISTESFINGSGQSETCCDDVYSQNTWYTLEMQRIGNDYKTLVDDVIKIEDTRSGLSTDDMYISLGLWADGPMYWDWIVLRKHAASPPTYAFGAEESAPTDGASRPLVNSGLARTGLINGGLIR